MESGGECLLVQKSRGILSLRKEPGFFAMDLILSLSWKAFREEGKSLGAFKKIKEVEAILCDPREGALKETVENCSLAEVYKDINGVAFFERCL